MGCFLERFGVEEKVVEGSIFGKQAHAEKYLNVNWHTESSKGK
jgi:hypothetical protein